MKNHIVLEEMPGSAKEYGCEGEEVELSDDWEHLKTAEGKPLSPEEEEVEGQNFMFKRDKYTLRDGREVIYSVGMPKEWWAKEKQAAAKVAPSKKKPDWGKEDPVWREAMATAPKNWPEELKAKILALKPGSTLEEIAEGIRQVQQKEVTHDDGSEGFALRSSVPNPFNPQTTIRYAIPEASDVQIVVYNLTGQKVRTSLAGRMAAGSYQVVWDGRDDSGRQVASGTYLVEMKAGRFHQTLKVTFAR